MSAFTPASEVLLRHSDDFEQSRILFAGDLQDDLPARLDTAASRFWASATGSDAVNSGRS